MQASQQSKEKNDIKLINIPNIQNKENQIICLTNKLIGKGTYGTIYFAYDYNKQDQYFAVKVIDRKQIDNNKIAIEFLTREITLLNEIKSQYVVKLKAFTRTTNNYYLMMELLNGKDLQNYVKYRGGRLKEDETRILMRQIVLGLIDIKKQNIVHRDIKLSNIMIHFSELKEDICNDNSFNLTQYIRDFDFQEKQSSIKLKLIDLGFARKLEDSQLTKTYCGTPLQMAPEILNGSLYSNKVDIWSLGCILYEMLSGKTPFNGLNFESLKSNVSKGLYKIPQYLHLSDNCTNFIQNCLQFNPDDRFNWEQLISHPFIINEDQINHIDSQQNKIISLQGDKLLSPQSERILNPRSDTEIINQQSVQNQQTSNIVSKDIITKDNKKQEQIQVYIEEEINIPQPNICQSFVNCSELRFELYTVKSDYIDLKTTKLNQYTLNANPGYF